MASIVDDPKMYEKYFYFKEFLWVLDIKEEEIFNDFRQEFEKKPIFLVFSLNDLFYKKFTHDQISKYDEGVTDKFDHYVKSKDGYNYRPNIIKMINEINTHPRSIVNFISSKTH